MYYPKEVDLENPIESSKDSRSKKVSKQQSKQSQRKQNHQQIAIQQKQETQDKNFEDDKQLRCNYYDFFKEIIPDPQNFILTLPSDQEFEKHKIKYLKGNKFHQKLHSYDEAYIRVKNTQKQGTIVNYTVIISMFELEIKLLNINQDANIQKYIIGEGSFGSVRIESENQRIFAVKRQMFKEQYHMKEFNMKVNKYEINQVIKQLAIYKICSLLKIGPAVETQIGFDLICYRDCIQFQIELCMKIDKKSQIFVDQRRFKKQIKLCLLTLHYYNIIHKDIKPDNILFSTTYNKYVFTDFGISQPVQQKIGYRSKTCCQGTLSYMSKQMLSLYSKKKGYKGYVHLYGNDILSLQVSLNKKMIHQNIEQGLKQFKSRWKKQYQNKKYEYEYLKLKYYCVKLNNKIEEVQKYWKFMMNKERFDELIQIVDKSVEQDKIKSVYNYLSKSKQFKECSNLESLRQQSEKIILLKIIDQQQIKKNTQLQLTNTLRSYGYSQQVKDIIFANLKQKPKDPTEKIKKNKQTQALTKKYKQTIQRINKTLEKSDQVNQRDKMFGNYTNYLRNLKKQLHKCQLTDYKGMFERYVIILQYGNVKEQMDVIQKLKVLKYQRNKEEEIEQIIRVNSVQRNKEKLKQFAQWMKTQDKVRDQIIQKKNLYYQIGKISLYMGKYQQALYYYDESRKIQVQQTGEQHPKIARIYSEIAFVYKLMDQNKTAEEYFMKSLNIDLLIYGQQNRNVARTYNYLAYVHNRMGNVKKTQEYFTKSLNIKTSIYKERNPDLAEMYENIGYAYYCREKYELALDYYKKSLEINKQFYGQQHYTIANIHKYIAYVYVATGEIQKALIEGMKSLKMDIKLYGQQHPYVIKQLELIQNIIGQQRLQQLQKN